jgi:hypothetical protein
MQEERRPPEEPHPDEPQDESVPTTGDGEDATDGPESVPSEEIENPAPPETQAPSG